MEEEIRTNLPLKRQFDGKFGFLNHDGHDFE